jgi:hypothetical protein
MVDYANCTTNSARDANEAMQIRAGMDPHKLTSHGTGKGETTPMLAQTVISVSNSEISPRQLGFLALWITIRRPVH